MRGKSVLAGGIVLVSLAFAPSASAAQQGYNTTLRITVPNVPVYACVGSSCVTTPSVTSVSVNVSTVTDAAATPPVMVHGGCAVGTGGTVTVTAGSAPTLVGGSVSATRADGMPYLGWLPAVTVPANGTVTVSACTTPPGATAAAAPAADPASAPATLASSQLSLLQERLAQVSQLLGRQLSL